MLLFELAGVRFTDAAADVAIGGKTWTANGDVDPATSAPGLQDGLRGGPFALVLIDNDRSWKTRLTTGGAPVGRELLVQETDESLSAPADRYRGVLTRFVPRVVAGRGLILALEFAAAMHAPGHVAAHVVDDGFQTSLADNAADTYLRFADRTRNRAWGGGPL